MTHFSVGIIVPEDKLPSIHEFVARQMAPYDEGLQVAPYVCYSVEQAGAEIERDIRRFERIMERRDRDYDLDKCREIEARLRQTSPEERYRERIRFHETFNARGEPISTYNPASKWDWYVVGGRWNGWITGDQYTGDRVLCGAARYVASSRSAREITGGRRPNAT